MQESIQSWQWIAIKKEISHRAKENQAIDLRGQKTKCPSDGGEKQPLETLPILGGGVGM